MSYAPCRHCGSKDYPTRSLRPEGGLSGPACPTCHTPSIELEETAQGTPPAAAVAIVATQAGPAPAANEPGEPPDPETMIHRRLAWLNEQLADLQPKVAKYQIEREKLSAMLEYAETTVPASGARAA